MDKPTSATTEQQEESAVQAQVIDYKMITFSLGGKDYGVDIMSVKEIAKFLEFTYVPNTAPFVRGVYNLRGDIISIIDLRQLFGLSAEPKGESEPEDGLILRTEDNLVGVIVDKIDRVVGVSSSSIQPPHPIFGDINIKYISGVIEHENRLFIILDVQRIFDKNLPAPEIGGQPLEMNYSPERSLSAEKGSGIADENATAGFISQELASLRGFHTSPVNHIWYSQTLQTWKNEDNNRQITNEEDADTFLSTFYTGKKNRLWNEQFMKSIQNRIGDTDDTIINVWNPGCQAGHETFSLAAILFKRFPGKQIKVWASDTNLLEVSSAPNLTVDSSQIHGDLDQWLVEGKSGFTFKQELKDSILFEYSDAMHNPGMPKMNVVAMIDVVSFMEEKDQQRIFSIAEDVLKRDGLLILGKNEQPLDTTSWEELQDSEITVYRKR